MVKKCASCDNVIEEEFGKLKGSLIKVKNEKGKKEFVYVCSDCEKDEKWIEKAVVRAA
tara:strand:+ start:1229 stop:1402 length:174 start_codon:yes stop_codon:yes gene_type:complete